MCLPTDKKNLMVRDLPLMVWEDDVLKELQLVYTKRRFDDESGKKVSAKLTSADS